MKNFYWSFLKKWYRSKFSNIFSFQNHLRVYSSFNCNHIKYTEEYKTVSLNLGRNQGASYAIAKFIKRHPLLNIKLIFPSYFLAKNFGEEYNIDVDRYLYKKGEVISDIDIVFIDNYSIFNEMMFRYNYKQQSRGDYSVSSQFIRDVSLLNSLNKDCNKNQWVIKFG